MNILDETVGPMEWKRTHTRDNANCIVSIWDEYKQEWISKEDTGTESNTEKEKGLASDSFKRACVNWGIGRELYTAPFIWIEGHTVQNGKGGYRPIKNYDKKLCIKEIAYDDTRKISGLVIKDDNNVSVFSFKDGKQKNDTNIGDNEKTSVSAENTPSAVSEKERPRLVAEVGDLIEAKGLNAAEVYEKIGVSNIAEITTQRLPGMIEWLKGMKGVKNG